MKVEFYEYDGKGYIVDPESDKTDSEMQST